ncbi:CARDB domain-containing protein [Ferruginibacter sp. SUN106]|uniref:CARDB domain-containing protein n=1 Tax=Ferruginibacter sp. SUN106 TaxID=2978348 RepID=UPI003D35CE96
MKTLFQFALSIFFAIMCYSAIAQTPVIPKGTTPGKINLPTPKIAVLKPDLQFVSSNIIAVEELTTQHLIRIKLSITYKNAGAANADKDFSLDLQGFFGDRGGTNHSQIGSNCTLHPLAVGQSRTEEWWFLKDVTALGRGHHQCVVRIDCTDRIAESDESNNNSPQFDINVQ